ncbi:MAG: ribokinase [Verrucomicrobia bacterium]|nr:ribokinase [Verrucomicrobiota bacterium]
MNPDPRVCVVGSSMHDQITRAARLPNPGETLVGSSYVTGFGGKGSNQAVMAARLGAIVTMVVKLGNDAIGKETAQHYTAEGIHTEFVYFDDRLSSGVAPIWVDENTGQNCILVVPGANQALTPQEIRRATVSLQSAQVVVCQMEIPTECNLEAFRIAKETAASVLTILNPAPSGPVSDELLQLTDLLAPNESEAATLTGLSVSTLAEAERAARALQARGARTVLITLGAKGALAVTRDDEVIHVAAPLVKAMDTTGAGDCFIGSLAYFMAAGFGLRSAMEKACIIASRSVTAMGTQTSFPRKGELDPTMFSSPA